MDKYEKEKVVDSIQGAVSIIMCLGIFPVMFIVSNVYGGVHTDFDYNYDFLPWIFGWILLGGLIIGILQIIKRIINPPRKYRHRPGRSGIGWGVGY